MKKIFSIIVILGAFTQIAKAQQGFGTSSPAPSSVIDMTATNKGALLPRIALTSTTVAAPVNTPANALTVFNTATTGDVTPGYYYWSVPQAKWVRLLDANADINNWRVEETITSATSNTQNIYQNGNVGIGDFSGSKPLTRLDVRGGIRGGVPHPDELSGTSLIGLNSVAIGDQNIASGEISTVIGGGYNQATGYSTTIIGGDNNVASNHTAVILASSGSTASSAQALVIGGNQNEASGRQSIIIGGSGNIASGSNSTIIGLNNTAPSFGEIAVGMYGTDYTPLGKLSPNSADRLFNVGVGASAAVLADAFTILKNGRTGIGFNNFEAVTFTEKLQVNGNARLSGLPSITGSLSTDKIVVADAYGVLKTVTASALTPSVRGGLRNNAVTGGFTELGGDLVRETTIATTISGTTHPLKITGLPMGDNDDQIMVLDNGQLKMVEQNTVGIEPWRVQGFTTKATSNGENIYQNAKVAIGNFSTGGAAGVSAKQLEVKGNMKAETTISGNKMGFEIETPYGPQTTGTYWITPTNQIHSFVVDPSSARAIAIDNLFAPTKASNFEVGLDAVNIYSKHNGEAKQATLELNAANSQFALYSNQVSANVGTMVKSDGTNGLLMYNAGSVTGNNVNGVDRTQVTIKKAEGVTFLYNDASANLKGTYTFPTTSGTNGQVMTKSTGNNIVWSNPVAAPKFFYAPSMVMPTTNTDLPSYVTYAAGTFTVDIYAFYSAQFGMTGDVGGAARTAIKSTGAGTLDVIPAASLGYFVTYFDNTVYDPASIALSADGKLSYKILPAATVTAKTYMNVVFKQL